MFIKRLGIHFSKDLSFHNGYRKYWDYNYWHIGFIIFTWWLN